MQFPDLLQRVAQARSILEFPARAVPDADSAYGKLLKSELEMLNASPDYYILHEHLEELNEPLYFHQFMERAQRHGLQYLADADVSTMLASRFPPQVAETVPATVTCSPTDGSVGAGSAEPDEGVDC